MGINSFPVSPLIALCWWMDCIRWGWKGSNTSWRMGDVPSIDQKPTWWVFKIGIFCYPPRLPPNRAFLLLLDRQGTHPEARCKKKATFHAWQLHRTPRRTWRPPIFPFEGMSQIHGSMSKLEVYLWYVFACYRPKSVVFDPDNRWKKGKIYSNDVYIYIYICIPSRELTYPPKIAFWRFS